MCCSVQIATLLCNGYGELAKLVALFEYPTGCNCELQTIACYRVSRVHEEIKSEIKSEIKGKRSNDRELEGTSKSRLGDDIKESRNYIRMRSI